MLFSNPFPLPTMSWYICVSLSQVCYYKMNDDAIIIIWDKVLKGCYQEGAGWGVESYTSKSVSHTHTKVNAGAGAVGLTGWSSACCTGAPCVAGSHPS